MEEEDMVNIYGGDVTELTSRHVLGAKCRTRVEWQMQKA